MSDLSFQVRHYVPDAAGEELQNRIALLKARDYAAVLRGRTMSEVASRYAAEAHDLAGSAVYADLPAVELGTVAQICRYMVQVARGFDLLEMTERAQ